MKQIDLSSKVAIVTGGAGDIGAGIATCLAESGANVAVVDLNLELATIKAQELTNKYGVVSKAYELDISSEKDVDDVFALINNDFKQIDILVNCAGYGKEGKNYYETPMKIARKTIDINLHGTGMCIKEALKYMLPRNSGNIINIASIAGRIGTAGSANYSISKAAIIAMTQSIARAHAKEGVRVNAVCPGYLLTNMWKQGVEKYSKILNKTPEETWKMLALDNIAMGKAQDVYDIGNAVCFLVSDLAKNITGQSLNVCGGSRFN
ncbi:SDR family oxidoreductase [Sedimentibacter sp.]|uniref:SDR family NAD(P)-dependent oxidoreductase n=1 Tax=Sedimentibacter sp. TaxID=1960295 RepID=UPI00289CBB14|nr:SDR family oxidoreductase [Sedimentibacter sp.]